MQQRRAQSEVHFSLMEPLRAATEEEIAKSLGSFAGRIGALNKQ